MTAVHKFKWFALSLITILFFSFVVQNSGVTAVRFMGWEKDVPRMLLISGVGLAGFIAGALAILLLQRHWHYSHPEPKSSSPSD